MTAHIPALPDEVTRFMLNQKDGVFVDCTLGDGGHSELLLKSTSASSVVVGIDRDPDAIVAAGKRLEPYGDRVRLIKANFSDIRSVFEMEVSLKPSAFLFDLGVSTRQILEGERGFSIKNDGPLDMRMDRSQRTCAFEIVNKAPEGELKKIFKELGEERFSGRIARRVVEERKKAAIGRTGELAGIVRSIVPRKKKGVFIDPATKVFQGLRIAVNGELKAVEAGVRDAVTLLSPGGRVCVISYHSLEDRLIKNIFKEFEKGCTCPPSLPLCVCAGKPSLKIITKRPVKASEQEVQRNQRVRSALLRVAEKV